MKKQKSQDVTQATALRAWLLMVCFLRLCQVLQQNLRELVEKRSYTFHSTPALSSTLSLTSTPACKVKYPVSVASRYLSGGKSGIRMGQRSDACLYSSCLDPGSASHKCLVNGVTQITVWLCQGSLLTP